MNQYQHIHLDTDSEIISLQLDVQAQPTNPLSPEVLSELIDAYQHLSTFKPKAIIFSASQAEWFSSGLDNIWLDSSVSAAHLKQFFRLGQVLCDTIEKSSFPTVAVLNGWCLGAGLELALACQYRVASPQATLSFNALTVGLHTAWGGVRRSIQLVGVENALKAQLLATQWTGTQAHAMGLVNTCVPPEQLWTHALQALPALTKTKTVKKVDFTQLTYKLSPARKLTVTHLTQALQTSSCMPLEPAAYALLTLWQQYGGNEKTLDAAEAESAAQLALENSAKQLRRIAILKQQLTFAAYQNAFPFKQLCIIGHNTESDALADYCQRQGWLVYQYNSLNPHTKILSSADLIIDLQDSLIAKQHLFRQIEALVKQEALLLTYTACLPLETIAAFMQQPQRLVGIHFPNPFINTSLAEVICEKEAMASIPVQQTCYWVRQLNRIPLLVKSSPGLLIQRILLPYIWEGMRLHNQGIPAKIIDKMASEFGMALGPLEMADTLGLDYCQQLGEVLEKQLGLETPLIVYQMVRDSKLGKKTGQGCHHYRKGIIVTPDNSSWQGNLTRLQERLIQPILTEAQRCWSEQLVASSDLLDLAVILGIGFPSHTGGPLTYRKSINNKLA